MRKILFALAFVILLTGCSSTVQTPPVTATKDNNIKAPETRVKDSLTLLLEDMSLEEKVGQLFFVAAPNNDIIDEIQNYHFGGIILFADTVDGHTPDSLHQWLKEIQNSSKIPLLIGVDEEGGTVCRISSNKGFRDSRFPSPRRLYNEGGKELLLSTEKEKCELLGNLGINVNLAPVCDITTNSNAFMYQRSLGLTPELTSECIASMVEVMSGNGIGSVLKHFPGYGNNTDTHVAIAIDNRTLSELESADLVPFQGGIDAGCGAIMVSHTIVTAIDSQYPGTLSPAVHKYMRENMDFDGVIITDDLDMGAITDHYGRGEAAVQAVLAGNDLLCTWSYKTQYEAVLEAVRANRISEEQLNDSVMRVLRWKQQLKIL